MPPVSKTIPKVIKDYYRAIEILQENQQVHEGAVAPHFAAVLRHYIAQIPQLTLVEQYTLKRDGRKPLRADGALVDKQTNVLLYGIWEAKDAHDNLAQEIKKKFKEGYPADNILFQSPEQIVLYQHGELVFDAPIATQPENLVAGLTTFLSYKPPVYAQWQEAVEAFREKVGELGSALVQIILNELKVNQVFKRTFEEFSLLCQTAINPNLAQSAVIEMLVQHLLTERLFRTIFNHSDFVSKNVIAKEIEKVIIALTSRSFSRHEFLKSLDRFYIAIEETASTIHSYSRKQDFLNAVYENFFQGFAVKVADTHGIVYTPQPIVDFMVTSVQQVLNREFSQNLSNDGVHVLDPFTGTGNFILRVLQEVDGLNLARKYHSELHCNEIMLLPYYIASLNIEHAYYQRSKQYQPFEGVCLVDTFELAEPQQQGFGFTVAENLKRVNQQKHAPIFVIIGNPPYNVGQQNENDNNKNRKYKHVDNLVADHYAKSSRATNKNSLSDAYVKAFAWATERLQQRGQGIIAFVTNNGFLEGIAADGMRAHLGKVFDKIYIFDLGGNSRKSDDDLGNVFGIRVGVAITILVKTAGEKSAPAEIYYARIAKNLTKLQKLLFLEQTQHIFNLDLQRIVPDDKFNWITENLHADFETFPPIGSKIGKATENQATGVIFKIYGRGVATSRDAWAYNFNREELAKNMRLTIESYNEHVFRYSRLTEKPKIDDFVTYDDKKLSWSRDLKLDLYRGKFAEFSPEKIRIALYRPFSKKFLFVDRIMNEEVYQFPKIFPTVATEQENQVICSGGYGRKNFAVFVSNCMVDLNFYGDPQQSFSFYTYSEDGHQRQENITDWALTEYRTHYQDDSIDKWDIFYYVYGLLHHTGYLEKYAANLKRELPHLPFASDFWAISLAGKQLAALHLSYETQKEYPLKFEFSDTFDWRVEKMRFNQQKTALKYNDSLTLQNIPPEVFEYRLGNRSALEWVVDQYQVSVDKRSGIINDPNDFNDERYIVELVGKIITVSLATVEIIKKISVVAV
jgi:predicted helicase